jgi:hypothetical protein
MSTRPIVCHIAPFTLINATEVNRDTMKSLEINLLTFAARLIHFERYAGILIELLAMILSSHCKLFTIDASQLDSANRPSRIQQPPRSTHDVASKIMPIARND